MNTVHISASKDYDVLVGCGLLRSLGSYAAAIPNVKKVCIVSERNVWPLYGNTVLAVSLQSCPTLCNPVDCSPLGSSVHGILQVRILHLSVQLS